MKIETFAMERLQSEWENRVRWNLSESGVHPMTVNELVDSDEARAALLAEGLGYPQTNGTVELRTAIAALYQGATPEHVEVTNGGSEANCISLLHLIHPGDEVVFMTPNYMQAGGLARALGAVVRAWPLIEDGGGGTALRWRPDLEALDVLVGDRTRLILICNPNNPTGARLTGAELDSICRIASRGGAWVLADEIYRGAEHDGRETATVWGRYERALVTSGLSKAYGLPGLRIGWIVGPPDVVRALWGVHDYTTIAPGAVNDRLARLALEPARRARILERTRNIIRTNYPMLERWVRERAPALVHVPPEAGAIAFIRFRHEITSSDLVRRLRDEQSVLVVPGGHFEMEGYLRIGFGCASPVLASGLERIAGVLDTIPSVSPVDVHGS
jgi:aspartate/methionine/tyrosine aminotransferase